MSGAKSVRSGLRWLGAVWDHLWTFWALLSVPGGLMMAGAVRGTMTSDILLHISGEVSARLLILSLLITPLRLLFGSHRWPRWLLARRRAIGVASFGYAGLHLGFYGVYEGIFTNLTEPDIAVGWLAFAVLLPLALTSTHGAVRRLGRRWKTLQRGAYVAAVLTAAHWFLLEGSVGPMLVHFVPLLLLEAYRVFRSVTASGPA